MTSFRFGPKGHLSFFIVLLIVLAAPLASFLGGPSAVPTARLTVMTRNLYVGASFNPMLGASTPKEVAERVDQIYARILASDFPGRAEAIAEHQVWREHQAHQDAEIHGERPQARCSRSLAQGKPARGDGGDGIEDERLPDRDPDLGDEHQRVILRHEAPQQAEPTRQDRPEADCLADAKPVDGPRRGDRHDDEHHDH